jgi:hypothetical protein
VARLEAELARRERELAAKDQRIAELERIIEELRRRGKRQAAPFSKGATSLPEGMRQAVIIDIRGQEIEKLLNRMVDRIVRQSNGLIQPENIHVRR